MSNQDIALTILSQMGGSRALSLMTGAKNFIALDNGVSFKIGRNAGSVSHVRITLGGDDLYLMEFLRVRKMTIKTVREFDGVYSDQLTELFREATGLETRIPRIVGMGRGEA